MDDLNKELKALLEPNMTNLYYIIEFVDGGGKILFNRVKPWIHPPIK